MAYVTLGYARELGRIPATVTDATLTTLIAFWSSVVESYTRVFFEERDLTLYLDGRGSSALFLQFPIISVDELYVNESDDALDSKYYKVYTDPKNPIIKLKSDNASYRSIFDIGYIDRFEIGEQNQKVVGKFGWIENGEAPLSVQGAIVRLVAIDAKQGTYRDPMQMLRTNILEEWTDGHRLVYGKKGQTTDHMIPDPIAKSLLKRFKAPAAMTASLKRNR